ncbi:Fe-S protein [Mycolicibacterium sp. ND9-15]|uniref:Fe-S protein n=1 Tax=Mycolicibacterium sp. ND9-15 TaxID=3042320 RepID=UPI002DD8CD68|nr:Fe-S protein [Mycolicibacterium sp. ND9-15]WSE57734.1 Fe-S protein [Mycolicibacterium sp. ND9-15]
MELLRNVVVLLHIVGFAVTFGAWVAEAAARRFRTTRTMDYGLVLSLLTGLALSAPWPAGIELNYPKIGTKLAILVILGGLLGVGSARQRRTGEPVPRLLFISVGVLSFLAAAIAVLW